MKIIPNTAKVWLIADTHFGDESIIRFCSRPFETVAEMDRAMTDNWNKRVGAEDLVFHLGDFGRGDPGQLGETLRGLAGRKRLVMGNHDREMGDAGFFRALGFEEVYDLPVLFGYCIFSHEPVDIINSKSCFGNVYGHVHDDERYIARTEHTLCVSVEHQGYAPVCWEG
ncbi:MAG: metallophosphoesterase [Clostridiales bacterium]|nr:metallophosphoesterase [Clostridiales bacterium]